METHPKQLGLISCRRLLFNPSPELSIRSWGTVWLPLHQTWLTGARVEKLTQTGSTRASLLIWTRAGEWSGHLCGHLIVCTLGLFEAFMFNLTHMENWGKLVSSKRFETMGPRDRRAAWLSGPPGAWVCTCRGSQEITYHYNTTTLFV